MDNSACIHDWAEALPYGRTITDFGTVRKRTDDTLVISASPDQARAWATRPGSAWPCSTLRNLNGFGVKVEFYPMGEVVWDLFKLSRRDEDEWVDSHETYCWLEDCVTAALRIHE